ncbi:phage protease [Paludibacterium denitrificans]|nr:phage protease [Paludibacterium denitrificans]
MNTTPKLFRAINAMPSAGRAINALTLSLPEGDSAPEWVEVIPAGTFKGRDGRGPWFSNVPAILQSFAADQAAGIDPVVDYNHQTCGPGTKAEAAGWIKQLEVRDGAIWARVEWVAEGAEKVIAKKYRYLSPVFDFDATGRIVKLISVAIVNVPNLFLRALNSMETSVDLLKQLIELLGLDPAADAAAVIEAIKTLQSASADTTTAMNSLRQVTGAAADADLKAVTSSIMTGFVPKAEYERVANSLRQLQAGTAEAEIDKQLDDAVAAGKIALTSRGFYKAMCSADMSAFQDFIKTAPVVVKPGTDATSRAMNSQQEKPHDNPLLANAKARAASH